MLHCFKGLEAGRNEHAHRQAAASCAAVGAAEAGEPGARADTKIGHTKSDLDTATHSYRGQQDTLCLHFTCRIVNAGVIGSHDPSCHGFAPDVDVFTFKVFTDDQVSW